MASILLIDDDESLRNTIAEVLRRAGYTVDTAPDGKPGLALYRAALHDLIITDIVMPELEGLELMEALRRASPRPRVIAMSGDSKFSESIYLPVAEKLGAHRTLLKPIHPDALLRTVAEVLAEPPPPVDSPRLGGEG